MNRGVRWAWLAVGLVALAALLPGPVAGQAKAKITFFSQQQVQTTAFEMAQELGYFAEEGLEVVFRYFPSGTTAFQAFRTGLGDIIYSGDVPAIRNWSESEQAFRVIAPVEKNAKGYGLVTRVAIKSPAEIRGKTIATRVGSSGSHFIWAFLRKHGMTEKDVKVLNLDGPAMVAALDRGDIDGFFLWAPYPQRALEVSGAKVHLLATADAVVSGYYTVLSARDQWIKQNPTTVAKFLKSAVRGQEHVQKHKASVLAYLQKRYGLEPAKTSGEYDAMHFLLRFDADFYKDFAGFAAWMRENDLLKQPLVWDRFTYLDGLRSVSPARATAPPR